MAPRRARKRPLPSGNQRSIKDFYRQAARAADTDDEFDQLPPEDIPEVRDLYQNRGSRDRPSPKAITLPIVPPGPTADHQGSPDRASESDTEGEGPSTSSRAQRSRSRPARYGIASSSDSSSEDSPEPSSSESDHEPEWQPSREDLRMRRGKISD